MIYTQVDEAVRDKVAPVIAKLQALNNEISANEAAVKIEDSKRKEAELRETLKKQKHERMLLNNEAESIRTQVFKELLASEYGVENNPKFEKAFELAWQHGHSSGYSEVEIYFSDFAELIK